MPDQLDRRDVRRIATVGIVSLLVALVITGSIGRVYSGYQVLSLMRGISGALHFLASSVFTALATILALTLTSVSFLRDLQAERLPPHYLKLIRAIALLAIAGMGLSILILLLTIIPAVQENVAPDEAMLRVVYYTVIALLSLLVGVVMMLMFLLMDTIHTVLSSLPHELVKAIEAEVEDARQAVDEVPALASEAQRGERR